MFGTVRYHLFKNSQPSWQIAGRGAGLSDPSCYPELRRILLRNAYLVEIEGEFHLLSDSERGV